MQRKCVSLIIISIIISLFLTIHVHAAKATVTENDVNIRSGPGTEFEPIGEANHNEIYTVVNKQNNWFEVELEVGTGWIIADYISIQEYSSEETVDKMETITIQHENTQIRSGPSTDSEIITFVDQGDEFDVLSETNQWYEIKNQEVTGFVYKELIQTETSQENMFDFASKTIVIDAGHGGHDVGAIGATGSYEKNFAYLTALELERELTSLGANVLLTRPEDEFISLESRASYSNIMDTDAFISIHYNSFTEQPDVTGIETYYYHDQDKDLAHYIQRGIIRETNDRNRGTSFGNYYVIRQNFKPAVLLELGFISNQEVEKLLQTNFYQKQLVAGIVSGLGRYFSEED